MIRKLVVALGALLAVASTGCIIHVTHYTDSSGNTVYVGELYSEGNSYKAGAEIQGTFFDAAGTVIATKSGETCMGVDAHRVVPFSVALPPGATEPAKAEFKVVSTPVMNAFLATGLTIDVTFTGPPPFPSDPEPTLVSGMIRNNSADTYFAPKICAAWYDANGDVVRVASVDSGRLSFPAGSAAPFLIEAQLPPNARRVSFFADAAVGTAGHPLPKVIDLTTSFGKAGVHTFGRALYFGVGEVHNGTSTAVHAPSLAVVSHDSAGHMVVGESLDVCPFDIPGGATSYGSYRIEGGAGGIDPPQLTLETTASTQNPGIALPTSNLTVASVDASAGSITGTVTNNGTIALTKVAVCGGGYDAAGKVVGAAFDLPALPGAGLAPKATVAFTIQLDALFGVPVSAKAIGIGFAK